MAVIDGDGDPPGELRLAWWCSDGRLPDSGGVLDQDYGLMVRMTTATNVYRVLGRYRSLRGAQIHSLTGSERKLLGYLRKNGLL